MPIHPTTTPPVPAPLRGWQRALIWLVALGAMAAVFAWYLQPELMLTIADQVWACF